MMIGVRVLARTAAVMPSGVRRLSTAGRQRASSTAGLALLTSVALAAAYIATDNADNFFGSSSSTTSLDIRKVREDLVKAMDEDEERRNDGTSIAPTLVRLAWHSSGTYSIFDKTGGSCGAGMRFRPESGWGANAGLDVARRFLEPIKKKHSAISYSDLWAFAGVVAIEHMNGPQVLFRLGRKDVDEKALKALPDGRLPNANMGCPHATNAHIRDIFGRMGFNDREIVALLGAHAVGRCHEDASGFWGPWTNAETTFSNEYFRLLLEEKWTEKKTHKGQPWKGPKQFEAQHGQLMMLPADLWLLEDPEFRKYVELYALDEATFFKDFAAAFKKLLELGM